MKKSLFPFFVITLLCATAAYAQRGPEWLKNAVIYHIYPSSFQDSDGDGIGDLEGIRSRLDYVKACGFNTIWLSPVFESPFEDGGYDITDYYKVDPRFGTNTQLVELIRDAHAKGIRICLDLVAGHTSDKHPWFRQSRSADTNLQYSDYYIWSDSKSSLPTKKFVKSDAPRNGNFLKNYFEVQPALNYGYAHPDPDEPWQQGYDDPGPRAVRQEIRNIMAFWMDKGVDGFRCDMAMLVPIEFWNETSLRLRRVKPDLFMLAEAEERNLFEEGAFDACYAWRMHHLMNDVARQRTRVTALRDYIYADRDDYPDSAMRLAFTSNHDENSWNGSEFSRLGDAREIMAVFTFVVPRGLPLIYTGQEIGYDHSFAFFDRDPIPSYASNAFTEFYRRLTALRHGNPALAAGERGGAMVEIRNNAEDCLMTFVRETGGNRVVAVMNLSPYAIHADYYTGIYAGMYTDAMTGEPFELRGRVEEDMAPWSYRILTR